ncbi:hypothetical protein [Flavihumibacter sp.]|uniref:hypothetical protein n=1 Tax=Flavihumibacter sp. TaxID=1913981 RepID=UPI002FC9E68A
MKRSANIYLNIGYWFMPLAILMFAGFYPTYFAVLFRPRASIIHLHAALMMVWVGVIILQPILIKKRRFDLHRKVGRFSYFLVPVLLLATFLMIRYTYQSQLSTQPIEVARKNLGLPFIYFGGFLLFYPLAVYFRRKAIIHAKYMIATAMLIIGPTLDRLLYWLIGIEGGYWDYLYYITSFLIIDFVVLLMLNYDRKLGNKYRHSLIILSIFLAGQLTYIFLRDTALWQVPAGWLMYPF